jgi:N-methylhydantoinase A
MCRVNAYGVVSRLDLRFPEMAVQPWDPSSRRSVHWPELGRREETPVYRQENLGIGSVLAGPAIVELPTTTVAVRPGQRLEVDEMLNYVITITTAEEDGHER